MAKSKDKHKSKPILKKGRVAPVRKIIPRACPTCGGVGFVSKCACCGSPIPYGKK